jgi:hypothetical protein
MTGVAVIDHAQVDHTRHIRPIRIALQSAAVTIWPRMLYNGT